MAKRTCAVCGAPLKSQKQRRFCSRECYYAWGKDGKDKNWCLVCGKPTSKSRRFCSWKCYDAYKQNAWLRNVEGKSPNGLSYALKARRAFIERYGVGPEQVPERVWDWIEILNAYRQEAV